MVQIVQVYLLRSAALCFTIFLSLISNAQISQPLWQRGFADTYPEFGSTAIQTSDGGYILASTVHGSVEPSYHGLADVLLTKLTTNGIVSWSKCYGGARHDVMLGKDAIVETSDGGYVVVARTTSVNGDVSGLHDSTINTSDVWVFKVNSSGTLQWQKAIGGTNDDVGISLSKTSDNGFLVAGFTSSGNGDITSIHGTASGGVYPYDILLAKLNASGVLQWVKTYGGSAQETTHEIGKLNDGNFLIVAGTRSGDGDVHDFHGTPMTSPLDIYLVKVNSNGDTIWTKCYGGVGTELNGSFAQKPGTSDIMLAMSTGSTDGMFSGYRRYDYDLLRLDSMGNVKSIKTYGGNKNESVTKIISLPGNGFVLGGISLSSDDLVGSYPASFSDTQVVWLLQVDDTGKVLSTKAMGGSGNEIFETIAPTKESSYIFVGSSNSSNGDLAGVAALGDYDIWAVKMKGPSLSVRAPFYNPNVPNVYPTLSSGNVQIDFTKQVQAHITVVNAAGALISERSAIGQQTQIDLSKEAVGMFFLSIAVEGSTFVYKIIKQ